MISSIELGGMTSTGALDCERWTAREGAVLSVGARVSKCRTTTYVLREGMMQKQRSGRTSVIGNPGLLASTEWTNTTTTTNYLRNLRKLPGTKLNAFA